MEIKKFQLFFLSYCFVLKKRQRKYIEKEQNTGERNRNLLFKAPFPNGLPSFGSP